MSLKKICRGQIETILTTCVKNNQFGIFASSWDIQLKCQKMSHNCLKMDCLSNFQVQTNAGNISSPNWVDYRSNDE